MMRILFIAPQPYFEVRGTCLATERFLKTLAGMGHQIDLLTFPGGEDRPIPHVNVIKLPSLPWAKRVPIGPSYAKLALDGLLLPVMAARLASGRYDLVHAVEESALLASWLAPLFRVPFVYDIDSILSEQLAYTGFLKNPIMLGLIRRLEQRAIRRAAAVTVIGPSHEYHCLRFAPADRIHRIEDVPACPAAERGAGRPVLTRERRSLGDGPLILYTGNLAGYQGIDLLLKAFQRIHAHEPAAMLVLLGGELAEIERYRRHLTGKKEASAIWFEGKRPMHEMAAEMADADLLVSPRIFGDNTPLKVYDYMKSGTPMVVTDLAMHTQVLQPDMAFLAPADAARFAESVLDALRDSREADRRARLALEAVETKYTAELQARKIRFLYNRLEDEIVRKTGVPGRGLRRFAPQPGRPTSLGSAPSFPDLLRRRRAPEGSDPDRSRKLRSSPRKQ